MTGKEIRHPPLGGVQARTFLGVLIKIHQENHVLTVVLVGVVEKENGIKIEKVGQFWSTMGIMTVPIHSSQVGLKGRDLQALWQQGGQLIHCIMD